MALDEAVIRIILEDAGSAGGGDRPPSGGAGTPPDAGAGAGGNDRLYREMTASATNVVAGFKKYTEPIVNELKGIRILLERVATPGYGVGSNASMVAGSQASDKQLIAAVHNVAARVSQLNVNLNPEVNRNKTGLIGDVVKVSLGFLGLSKLPAAMDLLGKSLAALPVGSALSAAAGAIPTAAAGALGIASVVGDAVMDNIALAGPLLIGGAVGLLYHFMKPEEKEKSTNEWLEVIAGNTAPQASEGPNKYIQGILVYTVRIAEVANLILGQLTPMAKVAAGADPIAARMAIARQTAGIDPNASAPAQEPGEYARFLPTTLGDPSPGRPPEWKTELQPHSAKPSTMSQLAEGPDTMLGQMEPSPDFEISIHEPEDDPWEGYQPIYKAGNQGNPGEKRWAMLRAVGLVGGEEPMRPISAEMVQEFIRRVKERGDTPADIAGFARGGAVGHPGGARGTDTVPVWLTPGEYIVPADVAARNRDELDDMTEYHAKGGKAGGRLSGLAQGAVGLLGGLTQGVLGAATRAADASSDPSVPIGNFGKALSMVGDKMSSYLPVIGGLVKVTGQAAEAFAELMRQIDETAKRYGQYSPEIAQAQAVAEIKQTMGDLRRAQEISNELAKYVATKSDLEQKFEDKKVKFLAQILPAVTKILETMDRIVPSGESMDSMIVAPIVEPLKNLADFVEQLLDAFNFERTKDREPIEDPASQILRGRGFDTTEDKTFKNRQGKDEGGWVPNI